jgi:hypothetical protein
MERDNTHELAAHQSLPLRRPARQHQAPASLLAALEKRIERYDQALACPATPDELIDDLRHEQWETRCAAIKRLGVLQPRAALALLENALFDKQYQVRVAALKALGQFGTSAPLSLLLNALNDPNWQVREMAVLSLGELPQAPLTPLRAAEHDANRQVREAAALVLRTYPGVSQSTQSTRERELIHMNNTMQNAPEAEAIPPTGQPALFSRKVRTQRGRLRMGLWLGAAVLLLLALTAAGTSSGWWNAVFGGNVLVYQDIGQQQTNQGVTITIRKVYADEGRTIIVYDITADPAVDFIIDNDTLTGSAPQKSATLLGTSCSAPDQGVKHCYAISPAFLVPSGEQTLRLTWDIPHLLVIVRDSHTHVLAGRDLVRGLDGVQTDLFLVGNWHFSFSVPFHHENRSDVPDPLN